VRQVLGNLAAPQLLGTYSDHTSITLDKKGDQLTATFVVNVYLDGQFDSDARRRRNRQTRQPLTSSPAMARQRRHA
jgi:hypothetical protein